MWSRRQNQDAPSLDVWADADAPAPTEALGPTPNRAVPSAHDGSLLPPPDSATRVQPVVGTTPWLDLAEPADQPPVDASATGPAGRTVSMPAGPPIERAPLTAPSSWPTMDLPAPPGDRDRITARAAVVGGTVGTVASIVVMLVAVLVWPDTTSDAPVRAAEPLIIPEGAAIDVLAVLAKIEPSVVSIETRSGTDGTGAGAGTGIVLTSEGLVLTNAHVVAGLSEINVLLFDGRRVSAELVGSLPQDDVALVQISGVSGLTAAELGSSQSLQVGEDVIAIGNALALGDRPSVTKGIVSAKDRALSAPSPASSQPITLTGLIQTDAAINPGNSGGPLVNAAAQVVGINTAIIGDAQNIGFSIAIDKVKPLIEEIRNGGGEVRGDQAFLGVQTLDVSAISDATKATFGVTVDEGAFVQDVVPDTAASDAGLEEGDVVIAVDGAPVESSVALGEIIRGLIAGDRVTVTVERGGRAIDIDVTLRRRG